MTHLTPHRQVPMAANDGAPTSRLARLVPLAGLLFVALSIAGDLTIGPFPDGDTPVEKLTAFYAGHHAQVAAGGLLLGWSAVPLAFFGATIWARVRRAGEHRFIAAAVLIGTAMVAVDQHDGGGIYYVLGRIGGRPALSGTALQALHIRGAEGAPTGGGLAVLLLAVAAAGLLARAVPRWLATTALALAVLTFTPLFFLASLLFLLWVAAASVVFAIRPGSAASTVPRH